MKETKVIEISVIVPLFKGNRYVKSIINQIEACMLREKISIEIIFVNDDPKEKIDEIHSNVCEIRYYGNKKNLGIHASRVSGLKKAVGEYILFLDQDDYICPDYFYSQMNNIGDADMSVCKLINGNRQHYTDSFKFEEVICKEFMFNSWCSIVSPGQVLIRKCSIPSLWKDNILKVNGADDYFLWLSMLGTGKNVVLNDRILFEHRLTGLNTSLNTNTMIDSEREVIRILQKSDIVDENDKKILNVLVDSLLRIHIKQLDNVNIAYETYNILMDISCSELKNMLGNKVAVYGAGEIGKSIYRALKNVEKMNIIFIDKNAKYVDMSVPVYILEEAPMNIDTVIIAINGEINDIVKSVKLKYRCNVMSYVEMINKVYDLI